MQRYNKNLRKSLLLAEYFSFWTINPYSEDIVLGIPQIFCEDTEDTAGQTLCVLYLCASQGARHVVRCSLRMKSPETPSCCVIYLLFWTSFEQISAICPKVRRLSIQVGEDSGKFLGNYLESS